MLADAVRALPGLAASGELAPTRVTLIERLRDLSDEAAWQDFFNTYAKLIYRAAIRAGLPSPEAEEVVQETIIGVARKMEDFRYEPQICSFKGWLMHVTRRRIIDHLRKRHRQPQAVLPLTTESGTSEAGLQIPDPSAQRAFEGIWVEEWEKNVVERAMARVKQTIKPEHYQIFYLHSLKNMPAKKISKLLHVSTAKVYVVGHRVARLIKREVETLSRQ